MPFIGIISEENLENCIRREILDKLGLRESNVLFIKEKSRAQLGFFSFFILHNIFK